MSETILVYFAIWFWGIIVGATLIRMIQNKKEDLHLMSASEFYAAYASYEKSKPKPLFKYVECRKEED